MAELSSIRPDLIAEAAYGKSKGLGVAAAEPDQGPSFGDMIRKAAEGAVESVRYGDVTAQASMTDKIGMQQAVEATMAMESTVRVSVALRDKLVDAYKDIINMSI
ncbi:flagellar hook-basal body complex protein FliE [Pseudodonghicola xiamenensis]|uniref:Flagellar hook-basal body complex protein FliE n=1 Tax=Pseudodonghicola xiamenensis TaxID=337702 RepID=A0A8J3H6H3_9RHOB|nr:flagellar hook-basal body complex protein FliE [Pseudodonghicola xiamenensis]GHG85412.1 hypothetical protein GCM10010961_12450 [Pseudodonghicola xiamenensis]